MWYYGQHMYWVFYKRRERKRAKISNNYSGYWFHEFFFENHYTLPLVNTKSIRSGSASESLSLSTKVWTPPWSRVISFTTGKRGKLIGNYLAIGVATIYQLAIFILDTKSIKLLTYFFVFPINIISTRIDFTIMRFTFFIIRSHIKSIGWFIRYSFNFIIRTRRF